MDVRQSLVMAIRNLQANKLRFAQTMLGLVAGVAGVVTLLNISQPMFDVMDWVFNKYNSPDTIHFAVMTNVNNANRLNIEDMRQFVDDNPDIIEAISPHIVSTLNLSIKFDAGLDKETNYEKYGGYHVFGVDEIYLQTMGGLSLAAGRFFRPMEIDREQKVCVVGYSVDEDFNNESLGSNIRIWGEDYKVIGVFDVSASDYNLCVMIPHTILKRLQGEITTPMQSFDGYNGEFYVDTYYMKAKGVENIGNARLAAVTMLEDKLGKLNRDWYYVSASYQYFEESAKNSIYETLSLFTMFIVVLLIVGGVGIINVMLATVQARTKEIGIRKAFGASNQDIRRQFLTESVLISLLGGLLGCGFGVVGTYIGCWLTRTPISFLHFSILPFAIALLVTVCVGVLSGTYPAQQAAKLEPVAAINSD